MVRILCHAWRQCGLMDIAWMKEPLTLQRYPTVKWKGIAKWIYGILLCAIIDFWLKHICLSREIIDEFNGTKSSADSANVTNQLRCFGLGEAYTVYLSCCKTLQMSVEWTFWTWPKLRFWWHKHFCYFWYSTCLGYDLETCVQWWSSCLEKLG